MPPRLRHDRASSPSHGVLHALAAMLLACSLWSAHAGVAHAFVRCDPFMLRAPEVRLEEPSRDSGFATMRATFGGPRAMDPPPSPRHALGATGPSAPWKLLEPLELGSATSNLVVDTPRDRLVLFGAYSFTHFVNHVWTRPLADDDAPWERLDVPGVKPGRYTAPTSVYDPVRERLIVLGGYPGDGVWALTLSGPPQWTRLSPSDPGAGGNMNGAVAIYDPNGDRVVVLAGSTPDGSAAVWAFPLGDASGWTLLAPEGTRPAPRENYHAVYDPIRRRMLVCAGFVAGATADLWALSLADTLAWESIPTTGDVPPGTYQGAAAFDPAHDRMVIADGIPFPGGGAVDDAWVLQFGGVPTWRHILPDVRPVARNGPCMAYDAPRDRFIMFGGGISDTWSLSIAQDTVWSEIQPEPTVPYPLYNLGVVHDVQRHRLLRFGGHVHYFVHGTPQSGESDELLGLTTDRFEHWAVERRGSPPPMAGMSVLLDPGADRLITLGGHALASGIWGAPMQVDLADTTSWRPLPVTGTAPPARTMQAAAVDAQRRRVVMFGGRANGVLGDGWLLDLNEPTTWTRIDSLALAPSPRYGHGMVHDPIGDRVILFGGRDDQDGTFADTWQLSLDGTPTWSRLALPTAPSARSHAAMVFDPLRQRVVLFGGRGADGVPLRDTWYLPLAEGATWVLADSSGALPRARWAAAATFDTENDRMVVLNGTSDPCGSFEDVVVWDDWEMRSLDPIPEPLAITAVERHPQSVALEWQGTISGAFTGSIARRTESSPWQRLASVVQSADGSVRFTDTAVSPGTRYAYRVTWSDGVVASTTEPVWTDVPALHLALERIENPARAGLRVSFSLPDAGPGRLDVLDVTGRTIVTRDVGGQGPGDHTVQLAAAGALVPGRYWVRLAQGGRTRTSGVVVLR